MKTVYDYLDYRDCLKDAYEARKKSATPFSYRTLAGELGLDTGNVFRILQGRAHLPARCLSRAMAFLGLSGPSAEYFLILITCSREHNTKKRREILQKAKALRQEARGETSPSNGSKSPAVPKEAIASDGTRTFDLRLDLDVVEKGKSRVAGLAKPKSIGGETVQSDRQILDIVTDSIDRFPDRRSDVSVLTFAADSESMEEIQRILTRCKDQIRRRIQATKKPDRILNLSMGVVPRTLPLQANA